MDRYENKVIESVYRLYAVDTANAEGLLGWELVSVLQSVETVHNVHLYFKRRLSPVPPTPAQIRTVQERTSTSMQCARAALVAADCDVERAVRNVANAGYT